MKRNVPEGAKVKFSHGRRVEGQVGIWYRTKGKRGDLPSWAENNFSPSPHGGLTSCSLVLPDGQEVRGTAECSRRDSYSKKIGRDIALGRALKNAEHRFPELFAKEKVV